MKKSIETQSSQEYEAITGKSYWYYSLKDQDLFIDSLGKDIVEKINISSDDKKKLETCVGFAALTRNNTGCCDLNMIENAFYLKILIGGDLLVRKFLSVSDLWLYLSGAVEGATCLASQNC